MCTLNSQDKVYNDNKEQNVEIKIMSGDNPLRQRRLSLSWMPPNEKRGYVTKLMSVCTKNSIELITQWYTV